MARQRPPILRSSIPQHGPFVVALLQNRNLVADVCAAFGKRMVSSKEDVIPLPERRTNTVQSMPPFTLKESENSLKAQQNP